SLLERAAEELGLVEDVLVAEYGPHVPVPIDLAPASAPAAAPASAPTPLSKMQENSGATAEDSGDESAEQVGSPAISTQDEPDGGVEPGGGADPDAEAAEAEVPTEPFDRAKQKARLEKAERKFAQLGRVNPLALEEFAALEQRHKFLTEQLADRTATH